MGRLIPQVLLGALQPEAHGRYRAWWPSAAPSSEHLEVMGAWTYTVTLADGSTRRVTG